MQDSAVSVLILALTLVGFYPLNKILRGEGFKQGLSKCGSWTCLSPSTQCVFEI